VMGTRTDLTDLSAAARAEDRRARQEKTAAAAELTRAAIDAMDGLELAAAVEKLDRAIALLEDADLRADFGALSNALALRAVALHLSGGDAKAQADEALGKLFASSPDFRFPSGRWSPEVQSWLESGRQTSKQQSPIAIDLQALAPALVWVDGLYRGIAPLQISGLVPGSHFLTLLGLGSTVTQRTFVADSGHPALEQQLDYTPTGKQLLGQLSALASGAAAGAVSAPGSALCAGGGMDEVLVLGLRAENSNLKLESIRVAKDGSFARNTFDVAGHGEDALEAAERSALASLSGPLSPPATGAVAVAVTGTGEPVLTRRSWSYVALGGSTAAFIAGIALGASAQSQVNSAKANLITNATSYDSAIKNAQTAADAADVLYAVAAVGAGVGGWLLYSSLSSTEGSPAAKPQEADDHLSMGLMPLKSGAGLSFAGHF
jgi:hypothetical protein